MGDAGEPPTPTLLIGITPVGRYALPGHDIVEMVGAHMSRAA